MNPFAIFFTFLLLQRGGELLLARLNEKKLRAKGAIELDQKGYRIIVAMHILFFVSLLLEKNLLNRELNKLWLPFFLLFLVTQFLRYWAILTLGEYWNTKVLVLPCHKLIKKGPYRYIKHPNYTAVIMEIATIPLIFSCYLTASVFSPINLFLVHRRIKIEQEALYKRSKLQ